MRIFSHLSARTLTNEFIVADENKNAIIIDPASIDNTIISIIEDHDLDIKGYLITHNHKEHTGGLSIFQKIYPAETFAADFMVSDIRTIRLKDGDRLKIGDIDINVQSCLGHTDDSLIYKIDNAIFTGDTIYAGSIAETRTNFEREMLIANIRKKILSEKANTLLFPGRGPLSRVRIERIFNIDLLESEAAYL